MFKVTKLVLYGFSGEKEYTYQFSEGVNYFQGKNDTGKTEFYGFLDYMFGSSENIYKKPWYKDSLSKALMQIEIDGISVNLVRTNDPEINFVFYADEQEAEPINLRQYRDRLNSIFTKDNHFLRSIREFTEEDLTYRTFTMFNFLGEKRQGAIHDFFDKCSDIKYSIKLTPILNFVFNNNLERIYELQRQIKELQEQLKTAEEASSKYSFVFSQVNKNLKILDPNLWFSGSNAADILLRLKEIKAMLDTQKGNKATNIAELEILYNNLSERIKVYDNTISDAKQLQNSNENRKLLLEKLDDLISDNAAFDYLVEPIKELLSEIESTIAFSQYTISDKTIAALKLQREKVKKQIYRNDSRFTCYTVEQKTKAIAMIEDYLSVGVVNRDDEAKRLRKEIRELKEELTVLQNADDKKKISDLSDYITELYTSTRDCSSVVEEDSSQNGFMIQYIKRGNILQPKILITETDEYGLEKETSANYYVGSLARHTLIQLCGYLAFLKMLLIEGKYPLIPIFIIDHISKPFDVQNVKTIGQVINKVYSSISKEDLQIFMFDDEDYSVLDLKPDHFEALAYDKKTGFNPFYKGNTAEELAEEATEETVENEE